MHNFRFGGGAVRSVPASAGEFIDSAVLLPEVWVGRSCRLRRCIIDRACVIPEGMVIGENAEEDARRFYRSEEGIVLVTREMLRKLQIKQER